MPTIKEVAEHAGVSVATVSRTLNNKGYVGVDTRRKVEEAIKELEYYPNELARALYQKSSKILGLLLPDISNPYFPLLAKGVEDEANARGYSVILGNVQGDEQKEQDYLRIFSQYNVSGILSVEAINKAELPQKDIPFIILDRVQLDDAFGVSTDDVLGGALAAQMILEGNPRNVLIMQGPKDMQKSHERLGGATQVLEKAGIPYFIFQTFSYRLEEAEETAKILFDQFQNVDSIIANNDIYALTIIKEAMKRGYKIPEDLQVVGYDDIPFSRMMYPALSTIRQPAYEIGKKGVDLLLKLLFNPAIEERQIKLEPSSIYRETTRTKKE